MALVGALACAGDPGPNVLALYEGGEVTRAELDRRVLARPAEARRPADGDFAAWYATLVREQAADELLLAEAEREAGRLDADPEVAAALAAARRRLLASFLLQRYQQSQPARAPISEQEVDAFFAAHRAQLAQAPRREVLHAYLRRRAGEDSAALRRRAEELRGRVAAGESFEEMARRFSDSESRHRGGALGWIGPENLDPGAAEVVFALSEGQVTAPVVTRDGAHLFLVRQAVAARQYELDEVRALVVQRMQSERLAALAEELAAGVEVPADTFVPSPQELQTLLAAGEEEALVLRVGDLSVSVGQFLRQLREVTPEGQPPDAAGALRALDQQARLALRAEREALYREQAVANRLQEARRAILLEAHRRQRLRQWIADDEELVRRTWEENRPRFGTPLRLQVTLLAIPEGPDPIARMADLEAARAELDRAATTLEALAARWGGTARDLGWRSLPELRASLPRLADLASTLPAGGHSAPFAGAGGQLQLARVTAREEPTPEPLEAARDHVVQHLLESRGPELYQHMLDEMLERARYRPLEEQIAALHGSEEAPTG